MFLGMTPVELSDAEKETLSRKLVAVNAVLREKSEQRYGEPSVVRLRQEYLKHVRGKHIYRFDAEMRENLNILLSIEQTMVASIVRQSAMLAQAFYLTSRANYPHLDEDDFMQEALCASFDAVCYYDGSTKFTTYCYSAVKNRLSRYVRDQEYYAGVGRGIKRLRRQVRQIMQNKLCRIEEAIAILRETEPISEKLEKQLLAACYNVKYIEVESEHPVTDPTKNLEGCEQSSSLKEALAKANLNDVQRRLIEGFLIEGVRIDTKLMQEINPKTGEFHTKQALSQQWLKACEKLRFVLEFKERIAA